MTPMIHAAGDRGISCRVCGGEHRAGVYGAEGFYCSNHTAWATSHVGQPRREHPSQEAYTLMRETLEYLKERITAYNPAQTRGCQCGDCRKVRDWLNRIDKALEGAA